MKLYTRPAIAIILLACIAGLVTLYVLTVVPRLERREAEQLAARRAARAAARAAARDSQDVAP